MEGRREDVETSRSPFSYVISLPLEVDGLSHIWTFVAWYMLWCQTGQSAPISSQILMSIWPFFK